MATGTPSMATTGMAARMDGFRAHRWTEADTAAATGMAIAEETGTVIVTGTAITATGMAITGDTGITDGTGMGDGAGVGADGDGDGAAVGVGDGGVPVGTRGVHTGLGRRTTTTHISMPTGSMPMKNRLRTC